MMATKPTTKKSTNKKKAGQDRKAVAAKAKGTPAAEKLSQIDAAKRVLAEAGQPMTCRAMVEAMAAKGLWTSPGGKTPEATLYSSLLRQIRTKGKDARFKKVARGQFDLA
jgi:hypothetical protein